MFHLDMTKLQRKGLKYCTCVDVSSGMNMIGDLFHLDKAMEKRLRIC